MYRSIAVTFCLAAVLLLACIVTPLALAADGDIETPRISVEELKQTLANKDVVVIDVRTQRDYWSSSKKIAGATRENPSLVAQWAKKYDKNKTLVFYCN